MAVYDFYNGQCKLTPFMFHFCHDHGIFFKHNVRLKLKNRKYAQADPRKHYAYKKECKLRMCTAS